MSASTVSTKVENESPHELLPGDRGNVQAVMKEVTDCISDLGNWINTARSNEETTLAIWDGQSDDGKKWSKNYGRAVFPWEGSADTRVRMADEAVDEMVMLQLTAFFGGSLRAMAMEANDVDAAGRVQTLLNYEIKQRLYAELWDEFNFAIQWKETFGHSVMHVGWERKFTTGKESISIEQLAQMMGEAALLQMNPELAGTEDIQQFILEQSLEETLMEIEARDESGAVVALLSEKYPLLSEKRVRQILKDLRNEGVAEFRNPTELPGKPLVTSLMPGIDVIYPWWTGKITRAPWVAVVEKFSEPEGRAKVKTDGWSEEFVEAWIKMGPQKIVDVGSLLTNLTREVDQVFNRGAKNSYTKKIEGTGGSYEVLRLYVRTVDEDGFPATQEIVFCPGLEKDGKPLVAVDRLFDFWFDGGCFVDFRREWKSRPLMDSRGVPELAKTPQWEVKTLRDNRIDRVHLATLPPLKVAPRRMAAGAAGSSSRMDLMPGCKVSSDKNELNEFMTIPRLDEGNLEMDASIRRDLAGLLGTEHAEIPQTKGKMHRQFIVNGFLVSCREVMLRILAYDQQMMSPIQVSRVIGTGSIPFQVTREEIAGQYDIMLSYDVGSLDAEYFDKRMAGIERAFKIDRNGDMLTQPIMRWVLAAVDPNLADLALGDMQARAQKEVDEEKQAIANLMLGIEMTPPEGANAKMRLETDTNEIKINPKVAAAYYNDPQFNAAMTARMQKWEFDILQKGSNATTGRTGWEPTVKEPTATEQLEAGAQPNAQMLR